jgi:GAF domain-containing protein
MPAFPVDGTTVTLPLIIQEQGIGTLGVHFDYELILGAESLAMLTGVGAQGAQALERARLYEAERRARLCVNWR